MKGTHHGLINRVRGLVWEDTSGEAGDHLLDTHLMAHLHDITVDLHVGALYRGKVTQ